ncbi:hypothetical protein ACFL35_14750, partial [Candidatus Riflebacteria bacterium]
TFSLIFPLPVKQTLKYLTDVAKNDAEIKKQLLKILALEPFKRKRKLNTMLINMHLKEAPDDIKVAIAMLINDDIAEDFLQSLET